MTVTGGSNGIYRGLYADTKPTTNVQVGARLWESDTGDVLIFDGTYWWLVGWPAMLSPRRAGTAHWHTTATGGIGMFQTTTLGTGGGTTSFNSSDSTNGRYINTITGTTVGNHGGYRVSSATGVTARHHSPKMRIRFMIPSSGDYTLARMYLGFINNTEPTGDDPLSANQGFMVGFLSGGTNFKVMQKSSGGSSVYTNDVAASAQALDTNLHDLRIVADEANTRFSVKWDSNAYVHFTSDIPSNSVNLGVSWLNETNDSGNTKSFRIYSIMVQTER